MNISIFASIWSENLWDELILKNEIKALEKKYSKEKLNFYVFSYDKKNPFFKKENVFYLDYFPIWIKNIKNLWKNISSFFSLINTVKKSDLIVIWWWWIIYDSEVQSVSNPLNSWLFRSKLFKFFKKDILFYWVWIDIKYDKNLWKVRDIFSDAKQVLVRDNNSRLILSKLWIKSEIIDDPVFFDNWSFKLNPNNFLKKLNPKDFKLWDLDDIDLDDKVVWIAFRSVYIWEDEKEKIKDLISSLKIKAKKIILIPHSFHKTDKLANDYLFLKEFALDFDLEISSDMKKSYDLYKNKKIDICLSMRLHSIILSLVYDIDFVAFSYSKKTDEILKKII